MFPVRLIYASTVTGACDPEDIERILDVARRDNPAADITGLLCFTTDFFLQSLEGPRGAVNDLYCRIARDRRHSRPVLLEYTETAARLFEDWSMAYLSPTADVQEVLRQYAGPAGFDPYRLDGATAFSLITDLATALQRSDLLA